MDPTVLPHSALVGPVADAGFLVIWEFQVKVDAYAAFEKAYGSDGDWAQLFHLSPGFLGTQLLRDLSRPGRYVTFDRWTSRDAFVKFKESHHDGYATLDASCEALTDEETSIGEFESCADSRFNKELR